MFKNWAINHIKTNGVNNFKGSIAQLILGVQDLDRFTSIKKYNVEHTRSTSRVVGKA